MGIDFSAKLKLTGPCVAKSVYGGVRADNSQMVTAAVGGRDAQIGFIDLPLQIQVSSKVCGTAATKGILYEYGRL
jgi:hypothetical protein